MYNDEILKIEKIGVKETIDISVDGQLFYANDILTHNSGFGDAHLDLTDIADSIGTTTVADIIFGVTQTDELREARKYNFILLKNRFGLNKLKCLINVNYSRMRLSDNEEKDDVIDGGNSTSIVDKAAADVLKTFKTNKKIEKKKIIDISMDD